MVIPSTTAPVDMTPGAGDFVPQPGVCPGCGRCRYCGQPAPMVPQPFVPAPYPFTPTQPSIIWCGDPPGSLGSAGGIGQTSWSVGS
jgi:hypothetical protein